MTSCGFTLIELLVVISIVALLVAVLIPAMSRARKQAKAVVCRVTLRQWATTLSTYATDYQGRFPREEYSAIWMLTARDLNLPPGNTDSFSPDANKVSDLYPIRAKGRLCSAAVRPTDGSAGVGASYIYGGVTWRFNFLFGTTFQAWTLTEPGPPLSVSYGLNRWLFDVQPIAATMFSAPGPSFTNIDSFRQPGRIPVLLDARGPYGLPKSDSLAPPETEDAFPAQSRMNPFCIARHQGSVNCLFLDWSVRKVEIKELWTLKWHKDFDTANAWTHAGGMATEDWPAWMRGLKEY
ncbi:MAG: type II secretion system protein [Solirubrobacterales bacterium]